MAPGAIVAAATRPTAPRRVNFVSDMFSSQKIGSPKPYVVESYDAKRHLDFESLTVEPCTNLTMLIEYAP